MKADFVKAFREFYFDMEFDGEYLEYLYEYIQNRVASTGTTLYLIGNIDGAYATPELTKEEKPFLIFTFKFNEKL